MTPMHLICILFDKECFELLMKLKPDLDLKDNESNTPISYLEQNDDISEDELKEIKSKFKL